MTSIHFFRHIHVFSSLGKRLPLDARAGNGSQSTSQCSDWVLPSCSLPIFGDFPLSLCPGASPAWCSRLGFDFLPDSELCEALQVCHYIEAAAPVSLTRLSLRQTVSRILALEALPRGIQTEERFVDVAAIPMGIDVTALLEKRYIKFTTT